MMFKVVSAFLMLLVLALPAGPAAAQDACFPHYVADVVRSADIRESQSPFSSIVGRTRVGDIHQVVESRLAAGLCWVKTSEGWLLSSAFRHWDPATATAVPTPRYSSTPGPDNCFPHDAALVVRRTMILASYDYSSAFIRFAEPQERFIVLGSWPYGRTCWVEITPGWLRSEAVVPAPTAAPTSMPATATPLPTATFDWGALPSGCYEAVWAFVTGPMNIRQLPTTASEVVAQARNGAAFDVSESVQGDSYCWLRIPDGWMAQTKVVNGTIPSRNLPRIEGTARFIARITSAYEFLRQGAPKWYFYVTGPRIEVVRLNQSGSASLSYTGSKRVEIAEDHLLDLLHLASVIVHEACHFYQYEEQRLHLMDSWEREDECLLVQYHMVRDINPRAAIVSTIRQAMLHEPPDD